MYSARVKRFRFSEVIVPAHPGAIESEGINKPLHMLPVKGKAPWSIQFDELPKLILELELDNGVSGLGEFYRDHNWDTVESVSAGLLGVDLADLSLQNLPIPLCREYDGFECAIWDGVARTLGVPLHKMLGGAVQDKVRVGSWSSHRTLDEVGEVAAKYAALGYDSIKFKSDLDDNTVEICKAVGNRARGMKVLLDPNQRWENVASAKPIIRELESIGNVLALEDPVPKWMYQDYADLRFFTSIPIVQHVSLPYVYQGQRVHDVANLISHRAVDGFNFNAGLAKFQQMAGIADAANMFCWHGSEVDLGVLEAMYLHQSAAARTCVWPGDIFGRLIREHDLLAEPLDITAPFARVPDGPGLGVTLDREAVERYAVGTREIF